MPAGRQGRGIALSRIARQCNPPPLLSGWGGVPPAFLTDVGGILCSFSSTLRTLLVIQLLVLKAKYTYQKLNIRKSKLLNCNINIKNPNQNQTISNLPPALLQSKSIFIFADGGEHPLGMCLGGITLPGNNMAQSKSFFGLRKGSTKSLTFSVYNGKQVTKDRVVNVKNPRSALQMKQRAIMATALHGYSALKEICDHSFEGVTYGQKSMNYFVKENARMIRSAAPNVNLSSYKGIAVSNPYIIAKGSLPSVTFKSFVDSGVHQFRIPMALPETGFTYGKFMENLGANSVGDMVTFVALVDNPDSDASVYWVRLKLTEENQDITIDTDDTSVLEGLTLGTDYETNIDNFTPLDFVINANRSVSSVYVIPDDSSKQQSLGIILSRKSDAGWLRSPSTMVSLLGTWNYNEALSSYPENGEKILNGGNV